MQKKVLIFLIFTSVALILVTGCTNAVTGTPDPITGHWGTMFLGNYMSLDVYDNGTGFYSAESLIIGKMGMPLTWEKNSNGTYTIITEQPQLAIISGNSLILGNETDNITLARGFTYTPPAQQSTTYSPSLTDPSTPTVSSTPATTAQEGTLIITIPPIGTGEAQVMDSEPVAIDGTNVGTVTSASPLTLRLPVGEHNLAVGSYPTRIIEIEFAKTNTQMMSLTDSGGNPSENAGSAASGANIVTNNIQGPRSFTGDTDSVQEFGVNQGGYVFSANYNGDDNFIVWITDNQGNKINLLFNTIGYYSGSEIVNLPAGQYYLDIHATGPYTINMAQS
jgi:hypothetical protein